MIKKNSEQPSFGDAHAPSELDVVNSENELRQFDPEKHAEEFIKLKGGELQDEIDKATSAGRLKGVHSLISAVLIGQMYPLVLEYISEKKNVFEGIWDNPLDMMRACLAFMGTSLLIGVFERVVPKLKLRSIGGGVSITAPEERKAKNDDFVASGFVVGGIDSGDTPDGSDSGSDGGGADSGGDGGGDGGD